MILGYIVNSNWKTEYQSLYLIDNTDYSIHYIKDNDKILDCKNLYSLNSGSYFLYNILKNIIIIPSNHADFIYLKDYLNYFKKYQFNIYANKKMIEYCIENKLKFDYPKINYLTKTVEQINNDVLKINELINNFEVTLIKSVYKSSEDYRGHISISTNVQIIKFDKYLLKFFPVVNKRLNYIDVPTWGNSKISAYAQMIEELGEDKIEEIENFLKLFNEHFKKTFFKDYNKNEHIKSLSEDLKDEISMFKNK
jgi:hypothetical protein